MGMLKVFLRQLQMFMGAVFLLVMFIIPAAVLEAKGHSGLATVVGGVGVAIFVLSLVTIFLEPLLKSPR